jgi:hypothetical protein
MAPTTKRTAARHLEVTRQEVTSTMASIHLLKKASGPGFIYKCTFFFQNCSKKNITATLDALRSGMNNALIMISTY